MSTPSIFVQISDIEALFRPLREAEKARAEALIEVVVDTLRMEAERVGKDLDDMVATGTLRISVVKSVVADVVGRTLMTSTDTEPMTQMTQSALGYSVSGSFLVPGGGLFIKTTELERLGLKKRQRIRFMEMCPDD